MSKLILSHYKKVDPKIHKVLKEVDLTEWITKEKATPSSYFNSLCSSIISQQLSTKAAAAIKKKFLTLLPHEKFTPEDILKIEDQKIRDVGISWSKIKYIKDLSLKVSERELNFESLETYSDEEVILELTKVKGIGRWTAEMFLMFTLQREDIFSFGDLGLKNGIKKVYGIENPTIEQITVITAKWSPYRTYGSIALWESLES